MQNSVKGNKLRKLAVFLLFSSIGEQQSHGSTKISPFFVCSGDILFFLHGNSAVFSTSQRATPIGPCHPQARAPVAQARDLGWQAEQGAGVFQLRHYGSEPHSESLLARKYIVLKRLEFFSHVTPVTFFRPVE